MSWLDDINNIEFTITTGDGKKYTPKIQGSSKEKEYNISKFEYINRKGSRVDRKRPKSNLYPLVFFFQGADNIDVVKAFETSADDSRSWTVVHPRYGTIKGQPANLKISDQSLNVTEVTVDFWEISTQRVPNTTVSPQDAVLDKATALREVSRLSFQSNALASPKDIDLTEQVVGSSISGIIVDEDYRVDYDAKVRKMIESTGNLVTDAIQVVDAFDDIYETIVEFKFPVAFKLRQLTQSYFELKNKTFTLYNKVMFEMFSGTVLRSMATTLVYPFDNSDYRTRQSVFDASASFLSVYDDYLAQIELNQTSIYSEDEEPYSPDPNNQLEMQDLASRVLENLFLIAFGSKQERTHVVESDTNLLLMTHKLLGLDAEDSNIEDFKDMNQIVLGEIMNIKKGRELKYFV